MRERSASPIEPPHFPAGFYPREVLSALFVFGVALSTFLFTLAPAITFGDSGELATAAITLGVAHPPGYPLWLILAKLFSFVPVGNVAYRLNLMSAILDAAALGILAMVISRTLPKVCARIIPNEEFESPMAGMIIGSASAAAALCLAYSPTFWRQSLISEVYALNNLLLCLILLLLVLWAESSQKHGWLFAASFVFGIGQANHQTLLLMAPAIALYVVLTKPRILLSARVVSGCIALFLLGLSLYLYLPIRASANPPLNWGNPSTWEAFWFHVLRKQYRSIEVVRPFAVIWPQLKFFFSSAVKESLPVLLVLPALFASGFTRKEGRAWLLFTVTAFLSTGVLLVIIANTELDLNAQDLLKIYFLPPWILTTIWIGSGMGAIGLSALRITRRSSRLAVPVAVASVLWLLLPARNFALNYREASMRGHDFGRFYGESLMNGLREGAILFAGTDSVYAIPMYMKWVEGKRPDISILSVNMLASENYAAEAVRNAPDIEFLTTKDYIEAFSLYAPAYGSGNTGVYGSRKTTHINAYLLLKLFQRNISEKPIYYEEGLPVEWIRDFAIPSGLVMELKKERVESLPAEALTADMNYWNFLEAKLLADRGFLSDIAARQKFSKSRSNTGALYLHRKMYEEAEAALKQAIRFSDRNIEAYALLAVMYREQGKQKEAVQIFDEYLQRDSWNTSARAFARSLKEQ